MGLPLWNGKDMSAPRTVTGYVVEQTGPYRVRTQTAFYDRDGKKLGSLDKIAVLIEQTFQGEPI
jgi:hypothetical protein